MDFILLEKKVELFKLDMQACYFYHPLNFITPGGTSRGVLTQKKSWFLVLENEGKWGYGECSIIEGLSPETHLDVENCLDEITSSYNKGKVISPLDYIQFPAVRFALEMALLSLNADDPFKLIDTSFSNGSSSIPINGLVWMGTQEYMYKQLQEKLENGFNCVKIKIAAISFEEELQLLSFIRERYSSSEIEIRVDANGGFSVDEAIDKLKALSEFDIHSIEQPIAPGQWDKMAELCSAGILDIALDEELIGVTHTDNKAELLDHIQPQYIILKPSLTGGFMSSDEWVELAEKRNVGWWATSALESNLGLNAIAQWVSQFNSNMYQGLGTGKLFDNNIDSPLKIDKASLQYTQSKWNASFFQNCC